MAACAGQDLRRVAVNSGGAANHERPLTGRSRYQRRGEYRLAARRCSFQTSPQVRQRQYDVEVTFLLVVVSSFDRQAGHALGGWTLSWLT